MNEQEVDNVIQKITSKHNEVHKQYESDISQKEHDFGFLISCF